MEEGQFLLTGLGEEGAGVTVTSAYKAMAARVLGELEASLGRGLPDTEQFMFVHGTAECRYKYAFPLSLPLFVFFLYHPSSPDHAL
jgi:hypothetical protein